MDVRRSLKLMFDETKLDRDEAVIRWWSAWNGIESRILNDKEI